MTHPSGIYRYRGRHSFGKVSGTPRFILPVSLRSWGLTLYVSSLFVLLTDIPVADGKPPAVQRFATQPSDQTQVLGSMAVFPCRYGSFKHGHHLPLISVYEVQMKSGNIHFVGHSYPILSLNGLTL